MKRILLLTILSVFVFGIFQGNLFSLITSRIEGTIVDKSTGQLLDGVYVMLFQKDIDGANKIFYYRRGKMYSDGNGNFKFDNLKAGQYFLVFLKKGYALISPFLFNELGYVGNLPVKIQPLFGYSHTHHSSIYGGDVDSKAVFSLKEGQIKHLNIELEKEAVLIINISKKTLSGIHPVEGGFCISDPEDTREPDDIECWPGGIELEKGKYRTVFLKEGEIRLLLSLDEIYNSDDEMNIYLRSGETKTVNYTFDFTKNQAVHGHVRYKSSGKPISYVDISFEGLEDYPIVYTDENGEYWLAGFPPGTYTIVFYIQGWDSVKDEASYVKVIKTVHIKQNQILELNIDY